MKLSELFAGAGAEIAGDPETEVRDLAYDSRRVQQGTLFFCVPGLTADGHDFAGAAVAAGATALAVERRLDLPVAQALLPDVRAAMAPVAARFFGDPTADLEVAGITGTNGKTTTAFLIRHLLERAGRQAGLLGTVKQVVGGVEETVERTTPEAIDLQRTFQRMLEGGDRACAMEVSSHALALGRARGVRFAVAAFTNLTQDHLDFHSDMEDYFRAKRRLFGLGNDAEADPARFVVNVDDAHGRRLAEELETAGPGRLLRVSPSGTVDAELRVPFSSFDATGAEFRVVFDGEQAEVDLPIPGDFNVANALVALGVVVSLGLGLASAAAALADAPQVPGRFEPVDAGQPFAVLVDYAHTPDSLENVLAAARRLTHGRLISVFGCGGDRDRVKRPLMGEIGARLSDLAIVTSDNPRSEDPDAIIEQIVAGVDRRGPNGVGELVVEPDRRAAIAIAMAAAREGDTVVVAGKGHEQGQEFAGGEKVPFDDREVSREEIEQVAEGTGGDA
jgi:UDP-N-acetylmuramoyl-L-alanyl-D-glutamate--2,6-diaminopimelate ligase